MLTKFFTIAFTFLFFSNCTTKKELPILDSYINQDGKKITYTISNFEFTNQLNQKFTVTNTYGKVYIANFFFTKCPSICPPMREQLINIINTFQAEDFIQLSFSIDPNNDTVDVLKNYSEDTGVSAKKWYFLRGSQKELTNIANQFRTNFEPIKNGTDFYHSSYVALVDKKQRIRGFYNLLEKDAVTLLKEDIAILLNQ